MNKKIIIGIIAAVVVIALAVGAYLIFSSNNYSLYTKAFKNTFDVDSMNLKTNVKAVMTADNSGIEATGSFKISGMQTPPTKFVNTMKIMEMTITQFSDGVYLYTDDGTNKNKIKLGDQPDSKEEEREYQDFSFEAYVGEFTSLLDVSKIKQLNALEPVAEKYVDKIETQSVTGGKKFTVTLLPQAIDELIATFLSENLTNKSLSPKVKVNSISYLVTISNNYISEILFRINMDVTAPNENTAKNIRVDFTITPVNPGSAVKVELPSTAGF